MSVLVNFAYGANLSPVCLTQRRGIRPITSRRAKLSGWTFDFTLRGIPFLEPAFGNLSPCQHSWQNIIQRRKHTVKQILQHERTDNETTTGWNNTSANVNENDAATPLVHSQSEVEYRGSAKADHFSDCGGTLSAPADSSSDSRTPWTDWSLNELLCELTALSCETSLNCGCYVEGMCYELSVEDFHRLMRYEGSSLNPQRRTDFGYIPLLININAEKINQTTKALPPSGTLTANGSAEANWMSAELDSVSGYVLIAPAHWSQFYDYEAQIQTSLQADADRHTNTNITKKSSSKCHRTDGIVRPTAANYALWQNRRCLCASNGKQKTSRPQLTIAAHNSVGADEYVSGTVSGGGQLFSPVSVPLLRQRCRRLLPSQRYVSLLEDGAKHYKFSRRYQDDIRTVKNFAVNKSKAAILACLALTILSLIYFCLLSPWLIWRFSQRRSIRVHPFDLRIAAAQPLSGSALFRLLIDCAWTLADSFHRLWNAIGPAVALGACDCHQHEYDHQINENGSAGVKVADNINVSSHGRLGGGLRCTPGSGIPSSPASPSVPSGSVVAPTAISEDADAS